LNNKNNNIPENKEIVGDNKKESKLIASISSYNNFNKAIGKYVYNKNLINNVNYKNSFMGIKNPNINDFQNFVNTNFNYNDLNNSFYSVSKSSVSLLTETSLSSSDSSDNEKFTANVKQKIRSSTLIKKQNFKIKLVNCIDDLLSNLRK